MKFWQKVLINLISKQEICIIESGTVSDVLVSKGLNINFFSSDNMLSDTFHQIVYKGKQYS